MYANLDASENINSKQKSPSCRANSIPVHFFRNSNKFRENFNMLDPLITSVLSSSLISFVKDSLSIASRLRDERKAGKNPVVLDLLESNLDETLDRIKGGNIDDSWWRITLDKVNHKYITPKFLQKPALQEWLNNKVVARDLKTLAKSALLNEINDVEQVRARLIQSYSELTGESFQFAENPINTTLAVLVSGYIASIPPNQRPTIGLIQEISAQMHERFDRLEDFGLGLTHDNATKKVHTRQAEIELSQLIAVRIFVPDESRRKVQILHTRLTKGDLVAADDRTKANVIYWCTRLFAVDSETLSDAMLFRDELRQLDPKVDLTIVDALIANTQDNIDAALRILRDVDSSDHRSVFFNILAHSKGGSEALEWYCQNNESDDPKFFTTVGWKDWAVSMCRLGKWSEATQRLVDLESMGYETPLLALIEGIINAAMLLPDEFREIALNGVPLYVGVSPKHGEEAEHYHSRATTCLNFVQQNIQTIADQNFKEHIADWQLWLRLMSPRVVEVNSVQEEIRQELESDPPAIKLIRFAFAFHIFFNMQPMSQYLNKQKRWGGLTNEELYAECIIYQQSMTPRDRVTYLNRHRLRLEEVIPPSFLIQLWVEALIEDNQNDRARTLINDQADNLDNALLNRLNIYIDLYEGADSRTQLEQIYRSTGSIIDLRNLIAYLHDLGDSESIRPLVLAQFDKKPNIENALEVVNCFGGSPFFDHAAILEFLDENHGILSESDDLKSIKARALFLGGKFQDSKEINDELLDRRENEEDLILSVNIAVNSGNWETIVESVEKVWVNRDDYHPRFLMHLAQLASQITTDENRALLLSKCAVEKAQDDPIVLTAAIGLHFQLGHDDEVEPDWLQRACDYSTYDEGPVWRLSLKDIVTQLIPERRQRLNDVEQKWLSGQLPIGFMAHVFNVPLVRLLRHVPKRNETEIDGRHRVILPIIAGGRNQVQIQDNWIIGLDVTSIIVLSYLGLLEKAVSVFDHVKLPHDVVKFLFRESATVRFHQPYLIKQAKQVVNLINHGEIHKSEILGVLPKEITDEVGGELAALLQMAQRNNGKVVCTLPIHTPGSFTEQQANTSEFDDLIISTVDLCAVLKESGKFNQADYRRARLYLESRGEAKRTDLTESIFNSPIYVDRVALFYLQDAKILQSIAALEQLDLRLHPDVVIEMNALIEEEDTGDELTNNIKDIRLILRNAVESRKASFLSHRADNHEQLESQRFWFYGIESLLNSSFECDAICIDDRCINTNFATAEPGRKSVPIICVLDVIRYLHSKDTISINEQWELRHKLRKGGYCFVPLETDELMHWLLTAKLTDSELTECEELRILRQTVSFISSSHLATVYEVQALEKMITLTCLQTISKLWEEGNISETRVRFLSDWVWNFMIPVAFLGREHHELSTYSTLIRELISRRIVGILLPNSIPSQERRSQYTEWVEDSVLKPLRIGSLDIIKNAVHLISNTIASSENNSEFFGYIFLDQLPDYMRQLVIAEKQELTQKFGFTTQWSVSIGEHFSVMVDDLFAAAKEVLKSNVERNVQDLSGREIQIGYDENYQKVFLKWSEDSSTSHRVEVYPLALLSPISSVRANALKSVIDTLGPAATDYRYLQDTIECTEIDEEIFSEIFQESTDGVARKQTNLIRKLERGSDIRFIDLVPQSISYYEKFCGPIPLNPDPEDYLQITLASYRMELLHRNLRTGLDICFFGTIRDDLSPGQWVVNVDDDTLWEALVPDDQRNDPFSLLGMLDITIYRQHDERFHKLSEEIINRLLDENTQQPENPAAYEFLELIAESIFNLINFVEDMSKHPSFWKRMCAWMQASLVTRAIVSRTGIDFDSFREWIMGHSVRAGTYSEFLDTRLEPMRLVDRLTPQALRYQVLVRLHTLKLRHESEGRNVPRSEDIGNTLAVLEFGGKTRILKTLGPLEFHKRPTEFVPSEFFESFENSSPSDIKQSTLLPILKASQFFALSETELKHVEEVIESLAEYASNSDSSTLESLELGGIIAATSRDKVLADRIAEVIIGLYATNAQPVQIPHLIGVFLQTASAYEEYGQWFNWLDKYLTLFGTRLRRLPREPLQSFIQNLDEIGIVLSIDSWFQMRARTRASSGEG